MSTTTVETIARRVEVVTDLEIAEYDKAGNLRAQYVESGRGRGSTRVDLLVSDNLFTRFLLRRALREC
jgi:hypothetical protein